jgi:hypothetical protein
MFDRRALLLAPLLVVMGVGACNQIFGISLGAAAGSGGSGASTSTVSATAGPNGSTGSGGTSTASSGATSTSAASSGATSTSTASTVGASSSSGSSGGVDAGILQDLVLLLHMDEPSWSGAGAVTDSSGHGNAGTVMGTVTPSTQGKFGGAGSFGGNGYINVPNSSSLQATNALTYAAWVYPMGLGPPDAASAYPGIIAKRYDYTTDVAFTMFIWFNNNVYGDVAGTRFNADAGLTDNQWYHVAVVFDGPNALATIYINGSPYPWNCTGTFVGMHNSDLTVGYLPQGAGLDPNGYFIGLIDEVAIWTRTLSANEIESLYKATGPL